MSFNPLKDQMRRQQEALRRRQQQGAWAAEQEKKRKRRRREDQLRSGGVDISDVDDLDVRGDIVGRDKVRQVNASFERDEKNGFILFIERGFTFLVAFGILMGITIGIASVSESEIVLLIGGGIALLFAISAASNVSRYRD